MSIGRRSRVDTSRCPIVLVAIALLACPSAAVAQRDRFVESVLPFYRALAGVYGDEGPQVVRHLDELAAVLTRWDRALAATATTQRARLGARDVQTRLEVHTLLASLYAERGQFGNALREADEASRADPARSALLRFKGTIYQAARRPAEAAQAFREAWLVEPGDPVNAYGLVVRRSAHTTPPELERAIQTLANIEQELVRGQRTSAQSPFADLNTLNAIGGGMAFVPSAYAPGFALLLDGDFDAGIASLRHALTADPLVAEFAPRSEPMSGGIAELRRGRVAPASALLETAVAAAPDSSEAHRVLATACGITGDIVCSVRHLQDAVRLNRHNERAWVALARTLDATGRLEDAVDVLERAIGELPDSGTLRWMLSRTARHRQRTDDRELELIATADRLVLLAGRSDLYERVAALAHQHVDDNRAVDLLEQRVALTPNTAAAHKALGFAYRDVGREDAAHAELVIALMLDPADADTLSAIGRLHLAAGRYTEALAALRRAVAVQPLHAQAVHALGIALASMGNTVESTTRLRESQQLQSHAVEQQRRGRTVGMLALQAEVHMRAGQYHEAVSLWLRVIEMEDAGPTDHLRLAEALAGVGRLEEAAVRIQMALARHAGPEAHRRLADVYAALGRDDESARERRTYLELRLQELRASAGDTAAGVK